MNKIEEIKSLYPKIQKKTKFIGEVAKEFSLNPQYVRGHYFSAFWTIPEDKQDKVVEMMNNKIEEQNDALKNINVVS